MLLYPTSDLTIPLSCSTPTKRHYYLMLMELDLTPLESREPLHHNLSKSGSTMATNDSGTLLDFHSSTFQELA